LGLLSKHETRIRELDKFREMVESSDLGEHDKNVMTDMVERLKVWD